jgi:hypothetical protein
MFSRIASWFVGERALLETAPVVRPVAPVLQPSLQPHTSTNNSNPIFPKVVEGVKAGKEPQLPSRETLLAALKDSDSIPGDFSSPIELDYLNDATLASGCGHVDDYKNLMQLSNCSLCREEIHQPWLVKCKDLQEIVNESKNAKKELEEKLAQDPAFPPDKAMEEYKNFETKTKERLVDFNNRKFAHMLRRDAKRGVTELFAKMPPELKYERPVMATCDHYVEAGARSCSTCHATLDKPQESQQDIKDLADLRVKREKIRTNLLQQIDRFQPVYLGKESEASIAATDEKEKYNKKECARVIAVAEKQLKEWTVELDGLRQTHILRRDLRHELVKILGAPSQKLFWKEPQLTKCGHHVEKGAAFCQACGCALSKERLFSLPEYKNTLGRLVTERTALLKQVDEVRAVDGDLSFGEHKAMASLVEAARRYKIKEAQALKDDAKANQKEYQRLFNRDRLEALKLDKNDHQHLQYWHDRTTTYNLSFLGVWGGVSIQLKDPHSKTMKEYRVPTGIAKIMDAIVEKGASRVDVRKLDSDEFMNVIYRESQNRLTWFNKNTKSRSNDVEAIYNSSKATLNALTLSKFAPRA